MRILVCIERAQVNVLTYHHPNNYNVIMCMNTFTPICIYRYKFAAEKILVAGVVGQTAGCTTLHEPSAISM